MSEDRLICEIFKSPRKDELYLYIDKQRGLGEVPEALLEHFGKPILVTTMLLRESKPLARANVVDVMASIRDKGFYLQMPPAKEEYLLDLYRTPTESRY
ncbi:MULTISPECIES: YcgL domain-containing protein [Halomonadaceae]|uniref:YcgL domain-containing protein n=1 Tax=Halomonadaceae TaxID=28256 RepID=UPI001598CCDF|nr:MULTISPECIES: YcgL domain-containing protein [Halomonas]QJQ94933.1 YcgL domain-containing protein [Halomonas sp. PA5]